MFMRAGIFLGGFLGAAISEVLTSPNLSFADLTMISALAGIACVVIVGDRYDGE